jgi:hypothetical protein
MTYLHAIALTGLFALPLGIIGALGWHIYSGWQEHRASNERGIKKCR